MKKIVLFAALLVLVFALAACGNNEDNSNDPNESVTDQDKIKDPAFDGVDPDEELVYPQNPQKYVVKYIREMAMTPWIPKQTFQLYGKYQAWSYNLTYEEGVKYYGPPFLVDSRGAMQEFQNSIEDGVYVGGTSDSSCIGSACYDAVYVTLIQVCPSISFESTADMLPGNNTGLLPVGDWDTTVSKHDTKEIMDAHTITEMAEAYALLKPGDVVLKHLVSQDAGHTRIVSDGPVVYYNSDGTINFNKSYILTIEQTNAWDKNVSHHTTWWVDHMYTFDQLYKTFFVPLTPEDYTKDVTNAFISSEDIITADSIVKARRLNGTLKSNHYITEVKVTISNDEGKELYTCSAFPNEKEFDLKNMPYTARLIEYKSGNYHFNLEASLSFGTKTIADYDFVLE